MPASHPVDNFSPSNPHKYNSGIIGNCSYIAHVTDQANVSWLCWPHFDSSFVFGGLLDSGKGGEFSVQPEGEGWTSRQYYLTNTNILCTEFETPQGKFRVVDFAPRFYQYDRYYRPHILCRKVELLSGNPRLRVVCRPTGDYGRAGDLPVHTASNHLRFDGLNEPLRLYSDIPLSYVTQGKSFTLFQSQYMMLTWGLVVRESIEMTLEYYLQKTSHYWQHWVMDSFIGQFHQNAVLRSALVLKLHQFEESGAIIAASTTSLPEFPGAGRNWDYRYSWIRDSYYTLAALNSVCRFDELKLFSRFIQNLLLPTDGRYQPLYSIRGEAQLTEEHVDLAGYLGNQPVRVGNQAYTHIQNDVYGQILLSLLPLYVDARFPKEYRHAPDLGLIRNVMSTMDRVMDEPDAGLWEFRNRAQHHCYTYLFQWGGAMAIQKIAVAHEDAELFRQAGQLKTKACEWIEKCYNPDIKAYTQAVGTKSMDASLLQLITMHYLDPQSQKAADHLDYLSRDLKSDNSLFFRYRHSDDFGSTHASFLVCAFWYVEALATMNRVQEAIEHFERLLTYANHLGLLSEDIDANNGGQWGNFPQTYSHVGLINAAFRISRKLDKPSFL